MADTERSLAQILTLLADNVSGDISPQDIRDMVVSLTPAEGGLYVSTSAETIVLAVNTPLKAAGTTTASAALRDFTMPSDNRLTYTGANTEYFLVTIAASITAASNNQELAFFIAKNGVVLTSSQQRQKLGTGADVQNVHCMTEIELATNDYVELWVENKTGSGNITVEFMNMGAVGFLE